MKGKIDFLLLRILPVVQVQVAGQFELVECNCNKIFIQVSLIPGKPESFGCYKPVIDTIDLLICLQPVPLLSRKIFVQKKREMLLLNTQDISERSGHFGTLSPWRDGARNILRPRWNRDTGQDPPVPEANGPGSAV